MHGWTRTLFCTLIDRLQHAVTTRSQMLAEVIDKAVTPSRMMTVGHQRSTLQILKIPMPDQPITNPPSFSFLQ
jgi:hypothetical protein